MKFKIGYDRRNEYLPIQKFIFRLFIFTVAGFIFLNPFQILSNSDTTNVRKTYPMDSTYFNYPDSVTIYRNGSAAKLNVSDSLCTEIVSLIRNRIKEPIYVSKLAVSADDIVQIKEQETVVELSYCRLQSTTYNIMNTQQTKKYSRLLFPLTGKFRDLMFFGDTKSYSSGPFGPLAAPDSVLILVHKYFSLSK